MIAIDMEMPQNCEQCRFSILQRYDVYCTAMTGATLLYEDDWHFKRVDRCPLHKLEDPNSYIVPFDIMIHPDEKALAKRDAFLSEKNGEKLNKTLQSLWGDD